MTYDSVFKKVFSDKEVLIHFLNAVGAAGDRAKIVDAGSVGIPEFKSSRGVIFDIRCTLDDRTHIIIELQMANQRDEIMDRAMGYVSKEYSNQWLKGEKSYLLEPVHAVVIVGFSLNRVKKKSGSLLQAFTLVCVKGQPEESLRIRARELTKYIYVQLPLAPRILSDEATEVEKWAYLLQESGAMDRVPDKLEEPYFVRYENLKCSVLLDLGGEDVQ